MSRHRAAGPAKRTPRPPVNTRYLLLVFVLAFAVLLMDQVSKELAMRLLSEDAAVPLLGNVISLQLVHNPGAAFSFASGLTWVFTLIAAVVIVVVVRISRTLGSVWWALLLGLLLGGAAGNLVDRLFRPPAFGRGHVVDFINYGGLFIGNLADIAIVGAAVGIAVLAILGIETDGTRSRPGRTAIDAEVPPDG